MRLKDIIPNNLMEMFMDRKFRLPRIWSNKELRKFAHLFTGDIINVSGWRDEDKEGGHYQDYFPGAQNYFISNFKSEARGLQGFANEFYLDLEEELDDRLMNRFDVVINHTTLEHVYDYQQAFKNLCLMSKDIVIVVVPFLQQMHADYGDYWRFTPLAIKRLFESSGLQLLYLSFNNHHKASVYIFAIGSKNPEKWLDTIYQKFTYTCKDDLGDPFENYVGCRAIKNNVLFKVKLFLSRYINR
ncbi:MAG: hypothetical protein M1292_11640 [Bacteroidetes bacterium]|nr:hypothetical protein [Bacteroidota bacterium]